MTAGADLDIRRTERVLQEAGLTRRQARALLSKGWAGVVDQQRADLDALKLELEALRESFARETMAPSPPDA